MKRLHTVGELLTLIERSYHNPRALVTYNSEEWHSHSTEEFLREVKQVACGLLSLGIKAGDPIGIYALSSSHWTIVDLAIMSIGAVSVPLFSNISEDNFHFQIEQAQIKILFVGGREQWKLTEKSIDLFEYCIGFEDTPSLKKAISFSHFLKQGAAFEKQYPEAYLQSCQKVTPDTLATIIYTSGTTGEPKGAEHTHHSITGLIHAEIFNWNSKSDSYLSFLPLAHVFARVINMIMVAWGVSIYYYNDIKNLAFGCQQVQPTLMIVVPRLMEKMYAKMAAQVQNANLIKKSIGSAAFYLAHQNANSWLNKLFHPLADRLVYHKLRNALGGNLRVVISGGAPLSPRLYHFFLQAGFPIFEGWGLTEACPVTVNRMDRIKIGTVGPAIPGMHVKANGEGELIISGDMMMRAYHKNSEATQSIFDKEGWIKTGDKGTIDSDGFVTIIGRLNELLKTSTGEKIAPIPMEQALCKSPLIDMAMIIGENRKFASCLLVPDFDALRAFKKRKGVVKESDEEFLNSPIMRAEMEKLLDEVNKHLNRAEKIRDFRFILQPLTIEAGELTPSMKIRRDVVEEKYRDVIEAMYAL